MKCQDLKDGLEQGKKMEVGRQGSRWVCEEGPGLQKGDAPGRLDGDLEPDQGVGLDP